ncbi:pullulanase-type alpha-1,6-glucosidase [Trueperella abortisuis]|uniref:Pullulanase-type alpha-1,6-glucosidase n=1 Tax=Trueperella abortisuis TaxID=445930 RepID=A0ABT9PHR2_9ACTO|nr:pullulanase-type alpha-1,6-glucosidase [Trueperella abortisuis]MDP9832253.1 pullulanase-type alpha-1,6-glucosidase [Trueperella abortisuis]
MKRTRDSSFVRALGLFLAMVVGLPVFVGLAAPAMAATSSVTVAGTFQEALGCQKNWDEACGASSLNDADGDRIWTADLTIPAGEHAFKVTVNNSWDGAFGMEGFKDGNYPLVLDKPRTLTFSFDDVNKKVFVSDAGLPGGYAASDDALIAEPYRDPAADRNMYFVLTDRFSNGNPDNDTCIATGHAEEGGSLPVDCTKTDRMETGFDPTDRGFFHGGDLKGLRDKLGYIKALGQNAIWLTPSFVNRPVQGTGGDASAGYHGYWVTDFTQIDPHFGTNQELKELIDAAHAMDMKVYFDIIANHTADVIYYKGHEGTNPPYIYKADNPYKDSTGTPFDPADYATADSFPSMNADDTSFPYAPLIPDGMEGAKYPLWLNNPTLYHNRGHDSSWPAGEPATYMDFGDLDDLMTENKAVREGMIDIYKAWVDFGVDGYRIDTVKHVNFEFWKEFADVIRDYAADKGKSDFFMFGEVYDAQTTLLAPYLRDTRMNAVLDFAFQSWAEGYAGGGSAKALASSFAADSYYTTPHSSAAALPTFLGNHDKGRIGWLLRDSSDPMGRTKLAHTLMYLTRGQPVLYYGDEQGLVGDGADKGARESMFATQTADYQNYTLLDGSRAGSADRFGETEMSTHIAALAKLRAAHKALATGSQTTLHYDDGQGVFAFARVDRAEKVEYLIAINNSDSEKAATFATLTPGATYSPLYGTQDSVTASDTVSVKVPALSAVVFKADRQVAAAGAEQAISVSSGAPENGLTPVLADVADDRWAETSFSYRPVGTEEYVPLGVAEGDQPRVFADLKLPAGTLVEVRAVSVDAHGNKVAGSGLLVAGTDLGSVAPAPSGIEANDVVVPGTHQQAMGCSQNWDPACVDTRLTLDEASGLYTGTWKLPKGSYSYKVALGGSWDVNYGAGGAPNGENVNYTLDEDRDVTFFYNPATHRFFNTASDPIITLPGSFNSTLGCQASDGFGADWNPACLSTLMFPNGDGTYTFSTSKLAKGHYEVKVAHGRTWEENYGPGGTFNSGDNYSFDVGGNKLVTFTYTISDHVLAISEDDLPVAGQGERAAYWVDQATFAWPATLTNSRSDLTFELWGGTGDLRISGGTVVGEDAVKLADMTHSSSGLSSEQLVNRGHLRGYEKLTVDMERAVVEDALRGNLAILAKDASGTPVAFTGLQISGVLDDLYAASARKAGGLGVHFNDGVPTLKLWAPTAKSVSLQLFDADATGEPTSLPMARQADGTWTITGEASWQNHAYRYDVEVFVPSTNAIEHNVVTDPYSVGLTVNSTHSVLVDLTDPHYMPPIWKESKAPTITNDSARSIYELHVRDFSIGDATVPEELRGTYEAFALEDTAGVKHLRELADAGMNMIHILPTFDIATIPEKRADQKVASVPSAAAASPEQQAAVMAVADEDGFNWGYDPYHYMTPEGSYAAKDHQSGANRTVAYRQMVGALHSMGYQVILDQVFNHTAQSGQAQKSVLDKVVPGYYHRLDATGKVAHSTCCENVATENAMAEQLMIDSVLTLARDYGIDAFRFDLMGHHSRANMEAIQAELAKLTVEKDGVDGKNVYIYGEGWNFGDDVQNNKRFYQATQGQLDGTGIGSFNDRLRDAVHGGSAFDSNKSQGQGFGNGQYTDPNALNSASTDQLASLRHNQDLIRLGMAGNLKDFTFVTSSGQRQRGDQLDYNGQKAGYAASPEENINYVDAHDNETLFDTNMWKLPADSTMDTRVRMNTVSLATVTLGQSPSFWHAGTDLLRSKSMDRNSYNSGDYFNAIDWTGKTHNFGVGLPPARDNEAQWNAMKPFLDNPANVASADDLAKAHAQALELLRLRQAHPLLTLGNAQLIKEKVTFPGSGKDQQAGLILMRVDDTVGEDVDPNSDGLLVAINASPEALSQDIDEMKGLELSLSPVLTDGQDDDPVLKETTWDSETGTVTVPARSAVVLVQGQAEPEPEPGQCQVMDRPVSPARGSGVLGDATGDRFADLWSVDESGAIHFYVNDGTGGFYHKGIVMCALSQVVDLAVMGDVNGDGRSDVLVQQADGKLFYYYSQGDGFLTKGVQAGHGWNGMDNIVYAGKLGASSAEYVVAREVASGDLYRYQVGDGGLFGGKKIGHGWSNMTTILAPGQFVGSSYSDLVAISADGVMYAYAGSADGGVYGVGRIGHGWDSFVQATIPGDVDGDGRLDLIGIREDGKMFAYKNQANGWWGWARQVGHGWSAMVAIS